MTKAQRLKEYGMYIRRNRAGKYNLGFTDAPRPGGLGEFPTYDDAYDAFEQIVNRFWEFHGDRFLQLTEQMLYRKGSRRMP